MAPLRIHDSMIMRSEDVLFRALRHTCRQWPELAKLADLAWEDQTRCWTPGGVPTGGGRDEQLRKLRTIAVVLGPARTATCRVAELLDSSSDIERASDGISELLEEMINLAESARNGNLRVLWPGLADGRQDVQTIPRRPPGRAAVRLLGLATGLLPASERPLYQEDWTGMLYDLPTRRKRAAAVLSLLLAGAPQMAWEMRRARQPDA